MSDFGFIIICFIVAVITLLFVWSCGCQAISYKQRDQIRSNAKGFRDIEKYHSVDITTHQWYLFTFRDPMTLYEHEYKKDAWYDKLSTSKKK